ncbi:unnamed protein product [Sphagnum troendelagicum]|uniref:Molybdenum cofactor sulfurase n=1 Tax=Sphagnum troendelagicum TaxID=128251 RepID=A0ABP0TRH1_9BRYO
MHRLTGLASSLGFFSIFPDQTQKVERSKNVSNTSIQKNDADGSCAEEEEKLEFLEKYRSQYGYPESTTPIDELRSKEFARLAGTVYVDHAGATLHSDSQLRGALDDLSANLYCNPHSQSDSSIRTSDKVELARLQVLALCNAPPGEYTCVFTAGATSALKLVGETFPWSSESEYLYTMENHNSVLGIREYALDHGATAIAVDVERISPPSSKSRNYERGNVQIKCRSPLQRPMGSWTLTGEHKEDQELYHLFAFPLECNFSGAKFDLDLITQIQQGRHCGEKHSRGQWLVLVDAAKGCGTMPPDLSRFKADFVAISFYKLFGYPTGLGALLVRNDAARLLRKKYFAGGTVAVSIADADFMQKRDRTEQWLEDGTASFLSIVALRHGFAVINRLQPQNISRHTGSLTSYMATKLTGLKHGNGTPVCILYGNHHHNNDDDHHHQACNQGPIVTFNLKRADGSWVGYREVEKLAALSNIQLRTGCFCNPGACAKYLQLSQLDLRTNYEAGHVCWDDHDVINGQPTGAVRVSFGYMSTFEDCLAVIRFIRKYFVESEASTASSGLMMDDSINGGIVDNDTHATTSIQLESIIVYPIKSCAGFSVRVWPLSDCGLLYDREWLIQNHSGDTLTQKKLPSMCSIQTSIDLSTGMMQVWAPNMNHRLAIPLQGDQCSGTSDLILCGNRAGGNSYGPEVAEWFTEALGIPCSLLRREPKSRKLQSRRRTRGVGKRDDDNDGGSMVASEISFVNEGQLLLVSKASIDELNQRMAEVCNTEHAPASVQVNALQFRPNLVLSGSLPNDEDNWQTVSICNQQFTVLGGCNRCQMVNIDQATGFHHSQSQPLATLASYRRVEGKITFGILLTQDNFGSTHRSVEQNSIVELETDYVKWLHATYGRLLSVGSKVSVKRRMIN